MLKRRPKIYSHPLVREAVKEALTERPLKWLPLKELVGYGDLNYAVWRINEEADIEPAKMETNIEAVIKESKYRIRSLTCKIEDKALLLLRLLQWIGVTDNNSDKKDFYQFTKEFVNEARLSRYPDWNVLYPAVFLGVIYRNIITSPSKLWIDKLSAEWIASLQRRGWEAEHLTLEQTLWRIDCSNANSIPELKAKAMMKFKKLSDEEMQRQLWKEFRLMPIVLLHKDEILDLASGFLLKNNPEKPLRWQILASCLKQLYQFR